MCKICNLCKSKITMVLSMLR